MTLSLLSIFIPTFFFVSITPGMCMTLSMTLGMTVGVKRTLWMVLGELVGVASVASLSAIGVAALLLNYPDYFTAFKLLGGAYLAYIGVQMWRSKGKMALSAEQGEVRATRIELMLQGAITALVNPKGWAFFVALLPPFLNPQEALFSQLVILISIILVLEFICLLIYASGGRAMRTIIQQSNNVRMMNRVSGTLMIGVGVWLGVGG